MIFRLGKEADVGQIMNMIKQGQEYLKSHSIDQWQNGYPNETSIYEDIQKGYTYVLEDKGYVVGTAAVIFDKEITYGTIYEGEWLTLEDYVVIHRIAIENTHKGKGYAGIILDHIEEMSMNKGVYSIKIDTHQDNQSMQRFLLKNGFLCCGYILLLDGNKRIAYEKQLNKNSKTNNPN